MFVLLLSALTVPYNAYKTLLSAIWSSDDLCNNYVKFNS